ncbi:YicC family protein [Nitratireductor sp. CAU 1489]|uniref:YicC family protein n=1 Tax=Nitratireductor arenosus TaxID=2682096 RepID=A0A844QQN8_9HYPH|nr:YicC/YloC family endoribonuclease [Nitratireductor arenosus]MVB00122.1 YicC family protein [Nitratireductor arenosus]
MALQSMTGFARAAADRDGTAISWEVRSVNGRGLDVRLRFPPGFERLELPAKQAVQRKFSRGNVQATLVVNRQQGLAQPVVNEAFLRDVAGLAKRLQEQFGCTPASADGLLSLRGVLDIPDTVEDEEGREALDAVIMTAFDNVLADLEAARLAEGRQLAGLLEDHVATIEKFTRNAEADPSREPAAIRERIAMQVALLIDSAKGFDDQRLHTEAAILATRADIREEIDRLKSHVATARQLLEKGGAVGRKLDFLAQEFNRESNTLCSKSNATSVTAIGLELKAVVDQFREQVQNLE